MPPFENHEFQSKCITSIMTTITGQSCELSDKGLQINYYVDEQLVFKNVMGKAATAKFLYDNGHIDHYKTDGEEILLFRKAHYYTANHRGQPVMLEHFVPLPWSEITFSPKDLQMLAAKDVWGRVSKGESSYGTAVYNAPISNKKYDA